MENHRNKKIKFLRSDRGGEYLSYEFGLHLKQCRIVSQLMPPGTPQGIQISQENQAYQEMLQFHLPSSQGGRHRSLQNTHGSECGRPID